MAYVGQLRVLTDLNGVLHHVILLEPSLEGPHLDPLETTDPAVNVHVLEQHSDMCRGAAFDAGEHTLESSESVAEWNIRLGGLSVEAIAVTWTRAV